jgi:CRP-like cAMP-binding protein
MTTSRMNVVGQNCLLQLLPPAERDRLSAHMQRVTVKRGDVLFERDKPINAVDFPLRGMLSVVVQMEDGSAVEIGTVGNEGMAGVPLVLGAERSPAKGFYQIAGESMRMSSKAFGEELARHGPFEDLARRYSQGFLNQVGQAAACNRLHHVEHRLCRWILMSQDRVASDVVALTQDFLAHMLGVRRASVSIAAGILQKAGLIRYNRGEIEVLDRSGLEQGACECYEVVRKEYERLLLPPL